LGLAQVTATLSPATSTKYYTVNHSRHAPGSMSVLALTMPAGTSYQNVGFSAAKGKAKYAASFS
jgi:hypothetical protein